MISLAGFVIMPTNVRATGGSLAARRSRPRSSALVADSLPLRFESNLLFSSRVAAGEAEGEAAAAAAGEAAAGEAAAGVDDAPLPRARRDVPSSRAVVIFNLVDYETTRDASSFIHSFRSLADESIVEAVVAQPTLVLHPEQLVPVIRHEVVHRVAQEPGHERPHDARDRQQRHPLQVRRDSKHRV